VHQSVLNSKPMPVREMPAPKHAAMFRAAPENFISKKVPVLPVRVVSNRHCAAAAVLSFGPHPRDYHQAMPKSMRRLALRCVLSAKLEDGELKILESFKFDEIKTKNVVSILDAMQVDKTTLVVTGEGMLI